MGGPFGRGAQIPFTENMSRTRTITDADLKPRMVVPEDGLLRGPKNRGRGIGDKHIR